MLHIIKITYYIIKNKDMQILKIYQYSHPVDNSVSDP